MNASIFPLYLKEKNATLSLVHSNNFSTGEAVIFFIFYNSSKFLSWTMNPSFEYFLSSHVTWLHPFLMNRSQLNSFHFVIFILRLSFYLLLLASSYQKLWEQINITLKICFFICFYSTFNNVVLNFSVNSNNAPNIF